MKLEYLTIKKLSWRKNAMTIIGLMGAMNVGKTAVLKMFVDYVNKGKIDKIDGGTECKIEKEDFKGESEIEVKDGDGFSKTITPNKVVFTDIKTGLQHTLFAPGGDRDRAVIRMGIITISRIAREIVGLFALDESLKDQFKLYDLVRYMPKKIYVCLNKYDLLEGTDEEKEKILEEKKEKIINYFKKRRIIVEGFFFTCAIDKPNFLEFNDNTARMILNRALNR